MTTRRIENEVKPAVLESFAVKALSALCIAVLAAIIRAGVGICRLVAARPIGESGSKTEVGWKGWLSPMQRDGIAGEN